MKKETKKQLLIGATLVLELLFLLLYLNGRIDRLLDSDMSSEMILGQLLARNNGILSDQWYYSTELRVLNTQLIYALFFRLSSNWHFVRMASTLVLWCVLIASYGVLCRVMGCKKVLGSQRCFWLHLFQKAISDLFWRVFTMCRILQLRLRHWP